MLPLWPIMQQVPCQLKDNRTTTRSLNSKYMVLNKVQIKDLLLRIPCRMELPSSPLSLRTWTQIDMVSEDSSVMLWSITVTLILQESKRPQQQALDDEQHQQPLAEQEQQRGQTEPQKQSQQGGIMAGWKQGKKKS